MTAAPPVKVGAVQLSDTWPLPGVATKLSGGSGTPIPPLVVAAMPPMPTAQQSTVDAQDAARTPSPPLNGWPLANQWMPSAVSNTVLSATNTQAVVDAHDTPVTKLNADPADGSGSDTHWVPLSVVTIATGSAKPPLVFGTAPAKQVEVVGHEIAVTSTRPTGGAWETHEAPPSSAMIAGPEVVYPVA